MIRRAYFEDPAYLPLLAASWEAWESLGAAAGEALVELTGGLYVGPAESDVFRGSVASARDQGLPHEVLDAATIRRRWPIFSVGDEMGGLYDPGAGMIRPERAIAAQTWLAEQAGAVLRYGERALDWRPARGGGLEVETSAGVYGGDHLVIAAGAWTGAFVPDLRLPLEVERMPVFWFEPRVPVNEVTAGSFPVWLVDTGADGVFYGFPYDDAAGLKVSRHHSGDVVDPDSLDRAERAADVERVRSFMRAPHAGGRRSPARGDGLPLHEHPGSAFRDRCPPGCARRRVRLGLLRARLQVRARDRRDPGGPGAGRRNLAPDRAIPRRSLRRITGR